MKKHILSAAIAICSLSLILTFTGCADSSDKNGGEKPAEINKAEQSFKDDCGYSIEDKFSIERKKTIIDSGEYSSSDLWDKYRDSHRPMSIENYGDTFAVAIGSYHVREYLDDIEFDLRGPVYSSWEPLWTYGESGYDKILLGSYTGPDGRMSMSNLEPFRDFESACLFGSDADPYEFAAWFYNRVRDSLLSMCGSDSTIDDAEAAVEDTMSEIFETDSEGRLCLTSSFLNDDGTVFYEAIQYVSGFTACDDGCMTASGVYSLPEEGWVVVFNVRGDLDDSKDERIYSNLYYDYDAYYFDSQSSIGRTGFIEIGGQEYCLADGQLVRNQIVYDSKIFAVYAVDSKGHKINGFCEIGGNTYLFDNQGRMVTGSYYSQKDDSVYTFDDKGVCVSAVKKSEYTGKEPEIVAFSQKNVKAVKENFDNKEIRIIQ